MNATQNKPGGFRIFVATAAAIYCTLAPAATLDSVRTKIAAKQYQEAAAEAQQIIASGSPDKAQAGVLLLRAYSRAKSNRDVIAYYPIAVEAAKDTPQADDCTFERIYSRYKNTGAKQIEQAYQEFGDLANSTNSLYAASGAAYNHAVIDLEKHNQVDSCTSQIEQLLSRFPETPFKAKALFIAYRCAMEKRNPDAIEAAYQRLIANNPDGQLLSAAEFQRAVFSADVSGDKKDAVSRFKKIMQRWPQSSDAVLARLRLADYIPNQSFTGAIAEYQAVISALPNNAKFTYPRNYALLQIALCQYQMDKLGDARASFNGLVAANPGQILAKQAQDGLKAIADPSSPEGLTLLFERGLRWREQHGYRDRCWRDFGKFLSLATGQAFEAYCNDENVSVEDRAQLRYRVALADFELGNHDAVEDLAQGILDNLKPQRLTRYQCLYLLAYHHAHCGHFDHAAMMYRELLDENPGSALIVPNAYAEMARCFERNGDPLGAVLAYEEFRILYPYRAEVASAMMNERRLQISNPGIAQDIAAKKAELTNTLQARGKPPLLFPEFPPIASATDKSFITAQEGE